jgi:hypothetical protein
VENQWNACPTVTASANPSANGIDSAKPDTASVAMCARISSTGSTAITRAPVGTSARVSLPVPAARSTTTLPAAIASRSTSQETAAAGYSGRTRS